MAARVNGLYQNVSWAGAQTLVKATVHPSTTDELFESLQFKIVAAVDQPLPTQRTSFYRCSSKCCEGAERRWQHVVCTTLSCRAQHSWNCASHSVRGLTCTAVTLIPSGSALRCLSSTEPIVTTSFHHDLCSLIDVQRLVFLKGSAAASRAVAMWEGNTLYPGTVLLLHSLSHKPVL